MKKATSKVKNYEDLNELLLTTLISVTDKKIELEEADVISKISDKIIKNNLTKILDAKRTNDKTPIEFFVTTKQVLIG